ncbi:nicotinamide riboside transporter PnuC [Haloflavibacter putidus]|uniref:Nicotinamide riboside transporter PnuC n=1 Tax=Haloflavibacter putidus TaxID=2576776 RepID=A0A507ZRC7_9FLAO|nr:nicotinamide riboside transporter PnuC [Haloflavibacter putidus]TQD38834.1 nicotinamide mononucleotide transporter [Haloflavibacter putidus]
MIWEFLTNLTVLQIVGTSFGVVQVLLARKNNIHNYLFGIVSILLSIWVHYQTQLYADILLSMYYLVMSIYGWLYWQFGKKNKPSPITYSTKTDFLKAAGIVLGCFVLMSYWLSFYTNSDVPIWDAIVSAFAWAGMWLMAKRKMENWIFLNISNAVAIPLLIYKELYIYAALTLFLFGVGVSGYLKWKKIIKNEDNLQPTNA